MNDNILKIKDKAIYTLEEKVNTGDYLLCLKYFPKVYWLKVLINSIFLILVSILLGTYYHSLFNFLISLVILEIINLISLTINYDKVMTKKFRKYNEEGKISNRYDFYIDYLIASSNLQARKVFYKDIVKFIETEDNFYLEIRSNKGFIILKKESISGDLNKFINRKFSGLPFKKEFDLINRYNKKEQKIMDILFCLSLLSIFAAFYLVIHLISKFPSTGFFNTKYFWIAWCFLPIPIISLILSFLWEKRCNNHKNLVISFLAIFLLGFLGSFSLTINDEDIYKFNNVIGFTIPSSKFISSSYSAVEKNKSDVTHIVIDYKGNDDGAILKEIENNPNWTNDMEIINQMESILPLNSFIISGDYYLIFNETTSEYNKLPDNSGKYTIVAVKYSEINKTLELNKYTINYKK